MGQIHRWGLLFVAWASICETIAFSAPTIEAINDITRSVSKVAQSEYKRRLHLDEVLYPIGVDYPELRSNVILFHHSKSRQKASFAYPRVLSHSDNARFFMTFNGDPKAQGFYELEMGEFSEDDTDYSELAYVYTDNSAVLDPDYRSESFKFQRIIFEPRKDYRFARQYHQEEHFPAIKPINELKCQGCHGKQIRPNWESYNRWEGTFSPSDQRRPGRKYFLDIFGTLHAGFDLFMNQSFNRGRYSFVQGIEDRFVLPVKPSPKRVSTSALTQKLGYLNYRRIAHIMLQSPQFDTYKYAILSGLYGCKDFHWTLPKSVKQSHKNSLAWYRFHTKLLFSSNPNRRFLMDDVPFIGNLRFLFEGRGISMKKWSMNFRRTAYSFVTPGGDMRGFVSDVLMEYDPALEPYRVWNVSYDENYGSSNTFSVNKWNGVWSEIIGPACRALHKKSCEVFENNGLPCTQAESSIY